MRVRLTLLIASCFMALPVSGADPAPVRLNVKPLLCVLDKNATSCAVTFDIRWKGDARGRILSQRRGAAPAAALLAQSALGRTSPRTTGDPGLPVLAVACLW